MKFTEEHKEKLRQAKLKNPVRYWLGKKRPELKETDAIKTMFKQGQMSLRKGKKFPEQSGENHFAWKGGPPKCLECGKLLGNKHYRAKYCNTHKGITTSGEKCHLWKGGITPFNHLERTKFNIKLRKLILTRDNYRCQICGSKINLQIDHIQPWAEFKELRFDPENCRTLCAKCHYKITYKKDMPTASHKWGRKIKAGGINYGIC